MSGPPLLRRLQGGQWAVLFGNGLGSESGTAGLFVLLIDPVSGAGIMRLLDTGVGSEHNGLVRIAAVDSEGDGLVDHVDGVDALGRVWRFDLTSDKPGTWVAPNAPKA